MDWVQANHSSFCDQVNQTARVLNTPEYRQLFGLDFISNDGSGGGGGIGRNEEPIPRLVMKSNTGAWFDDEFLPSVANFNSAIEKWKDVGNRTPRITAAVQIAREDLEPKYRKLYGMLKSSLAANKENFAAMGLPWNDGKQHSQPELPHSYPAATKMDFPTPNEIAVHVRDQNSDRRGKPAGYHGVEMLYAILDHEPTSISELVHSAFSTTTPIRLSFDFSKRGKVLYFVLRWENKRAQKGPCSDYYHILIP
ncbi:MAG: hypothetical protein LBH04_11435 [Tannerellaceae bacterium]|jgi:hypothetical protein|nr:hypothetical protein [Tannerellaceae bacterium]